MPIVAYGYGLSEAGVATGFALIDGVEIVDEIEVEVVPPIEVEIVEPIEVEIVEPIEVEVD